MGEAAAVGTRRMGARREWPLRAAGGAVNIVDVNWLLRWLENTGKLLSEADKIGLWSKWDDCSDNRNKRRLLREADWEASAAMREVVKMREGDPRPELAELEAELRALVAFLEPLPDLVTDTMGENPQLDLKIGKAMETVERLRQRAAAVCE